MAFIIKQGPQSRIIEHVYANGKHYANCVDKNGKPFTVLLGKSNG